MDKNDQAAVSAAREPTLEEQIEMALLDAQAARLSMPVNWTPATEAQRRLDVRTAILASLRRLAGREGEQVPRGVLLDAIEALRNERDAESNNARLWEREAKKLGWRP